MDEETFTDEELRELDLIAQDWDRRVLAARYLEPYARDWNAYVEGMRQRLEEVAYHGSI